MPSGVKDIQLLELKDTISQLNKTISTQNELISSLQKMLEERNAKDSEKDLLIANLQSQLAYLKNKVFGSTSEIRHDQLDGQLNLFGTPVGDEKPAEVIEPEVISVKGYTKERKPKATYDDKYNSVRSICKHFFTDIVGLSIKFFCVSLRHMSIWGRIISTSISSITRRSVQNREMVPVYMRQCWKRRSRGRSDTSGSPTTGWLQRRKPFVLGSMKPCSFLFLTLPPRMTGN